MALSEARLLAAARRGYERSRLKLALAVALPALLIPVVSWLLGTSLRNASLFGAALVLGLAALEWRGGLYALGGLSGFKAGLVPLAFAHTAKLWGHVCTPAGCTTLCVPACATGGVLAGVLVEWWARRSPRPWLTRGLGAAVSLITGAMGCSCVGAAGIAALVVGVGVSMAAGAAIPRARTA